MTTSLTLRSSLASGKERICITLPDTVYSIKEDQSQSAVDISLMNPTNSLEVSQSSQSYKSAKEEVEPERTRTFRQILNIDQALQGDYTGIEVREQAELLTAEEVEHYRQLEDISLPSWCNTDFWEAHSAKSRN